MISKRTKDAFKAAKARGVRLGNPTPLIASQKGIATILEQKRQFRGTAKPLITELRDQGYTLTAIAEALNDRNIPTARGALWYATTVRNILNDRDDL
jgi:DNA invertase Pin-like site-specific DNA recombinase